MSGGPTTRAQGPTPADVGIVAATAIEVGPLLAVVQPVEGDNKGVDEHPGQQGA